MTWTSPPIRRPTAPQPPRAAGRPDGPPSGPATGGRGGPVQAPRTGSARPAPAGPDPDPGVRLVHPRPIELPIDGPTGGPIDLRSGTSGEPDVRGPVGSLVPNLMIAGVTHCGATELSRRLGRHPEIKRSSVKRIDLFDPLRYDRPMVGSVADYDQFFVGWTGQRYRLECSATYFDGGRELVRTVARDLPGLRVLIVLRDPAERLWLGFQDKVSSGRLPAATNYVTYVERCLALRANGAERFEGNRYFRTLSSGLYAEHLHPWLELFGPRVRVVFTEQLERNPEQVLSGLHAWLGLEPTPLGLTAWPEQGAGLVPRPDRRPGRRVELPNGLQRFESPPERGPGRFGPDGLTGRLLAALGRRRPGGPPPSPADRVYRRSNRELAELLRGCEVAELPGWLRR